MTKNEVAVVDVKFNQNVKFNQERYRKAEVLMVTEIEYNQLLGSGVIDEIADLEWPEPEKAVDLSQLTKEELDEINKPIIAEYLDSKEIEYSSKATKDELIALIVGE